MRHVSLCTGYGGIDLGLKRIIPSLKTVAYSEIEYFAVKNLIAKMECGLLDSAPIWTDLKTFPEDLSRFGVDGVDLVSGGFPCQPFSCAGQRKGDADTRHLFPHILKIIENYKPKGVFLENVEGIVSSKLKGNNWTDPEGTSVLLHVLRELERRGYAPTWGIFSAEEVGAPHRRKRVFILAKRMGDTKHDGYATAEARGSVGAEQEERRLSEFEGRCGEPSDELAHNKRQRVEEQHRQEPEQQEQYTSWNNGGNVWPARPGEQQHKWEPPRVLNVSESGRCWHRIANRHGKLADHRGEEQQGIPQPVERQQSVEAGESSRSGTLEPPLGRNFNESSCGLDYAELCRTCDNRTDELRLLGNGVLPATAERAWRILYQRIKG